MKTTTALMAMICLAFLSGTLTLFGQSNDLSTIGLVGKAEITTQEGQKMKVKSLRYENGSVLYTNKEGVTETLTEDQIYRIDKLGNYAVEGMLGGALGGLLGSFTGTLNWDKNPDLKDSKGAFIIGSTIGGGLLGLIIGAATTKSYTVYKNISLSLGVPITPVPGMGIHTEGGTFCIGIVIPLQKHK